MLRRKWVRGSGAHDRSPSPARKVSPQRAHPPRVRLRGDDNHRGALLLLQLRCNGSHFVSRIVYRRFTRPRLPLLHTLPPSKTTAGERTTQVVGSTSPSRGGLV